MNLSKEEEIKDDFKLSVVASKPLPNKFNPKKKQPNSTKNADNNKKFTF
jgi:hypothetical protein